MNEVSDDQLIAAAEQDADALASPWQPDIVARTFLVKPVCVGKWSLWPLTMEGWLILDHARSRYLAPPEGEVDLLSSLVLALCVLGNTPVDPEEILASDQDTVLDLHLAVQQIIAESAMTSLRMVDPHVRHTSSVHGDEGFGVWLLVYTSLITELGLQPKQIRAMYVHQAHALLCAARRNAGWRVEGENYRMKELIEHGQSTGN